MGKNIYWNGMLLTSDSASIRKLSGQDRFKIDMGYGMVFTNEFKNYGGESLLNAFEVWQIDGDCF